MDIMNKTLERAMLHAQHCQRLLKDAKRPAIAKDAVIEPDTRHHMPKVKEGYRMCSVCHRIKPLEEYHFSDKKTGRRKAMCKNCLNSVARVKAKERRELLKLKQLTSR